MARLPKEHKELIQRSYARFHEICEQLPAVGNQVVIAKCAFWGGLAIIIYTVL
jgi:hypothetical protein